MCSRQEQGARCYWLFGRAQPIFLWKWSSDVGASGSIQCCFERNKKAAPPWVAAENLLARIQEAVQVDVALRRKRAAISGVHELLGRLTRREREIAELLAIGESCKQIARQLSEGADEESLDPSTRALIERAGV